MHKVFNIHQSALLYFRMSQQQFLLGGRCGVYTGRGNRYSVVPIPIMHKAVRGVDVGCDVRKGLCVQVAGELGSSC